MTTGPEITWRFDFTSARGSGSFEIDPTNFVIPTSAAHPSTFDVIAADIDIKKQIFAPPAPDEFAGQLTIGTKWKDTENIKQLVAAFKDPAVQEFLRTDPSVKNILLPL